MESITVKNWVIRLESCHYYNTMLGAVTLEKATHFTDAELAWSFANNTPSLKDKINNVLPVITTSVVLDV